MVNARVLTVDDDTATRRLIKLILELEGVEVFEAANGPECLGVLRNQPIDLILLDINMPGMSGWDVMRALRSITSLATIPTIILSGERPNEQLTSELQPQGYISKPFEIDELISHVKKLLQNTCCHQSNGYNRPVAV